MPSSAFSVHHASLSILFSDKKSCPFFTSVFCMPPVPGCARPTPTPGLPLQEATRLAGAESCLGDQLTPLQSGLVDPSRELRGYTTPPLHGECSVKEAVRTHDAAFDQTSPLACLAWHGLFLLGNSSPVSSSSSFSWRCSGVEPARPILATPVLCHCPGLFRRSSAAVSNHEASPAIFREHQSS